jgi:pyridoxine 4-dehydrogenase
MRASLAAGCNFWSTFDRPQEEGTMALTLIDAGEFYGTPEFNSLTLMEKYFTKYPDDAVKVVLSIKGGLGSNMAPDGSPEGVRKSIDNCLALLKDKKFIDIFECARVDRNTPIETTLKIMDEEYVKTGKIGGIALSEVSAATIEKAVKVTKIVAVEVELSLWSTDALTNGIAESCAKHGIPLVAYVETPPFIA